MLACQRRTSAQLLFTCCYPKDDFLYLWISFEIFDHMCLKMLFIIDSCCFSSYCIVEFLLENRLFLMLSTMPFLRLLPVNAQLQLLTTAVDYVTVLIDSMCVSLI